MSHLTVKPIGLSREWLEAMASVLGIPAQIMDIWAKISSSVCQSLLELRVDGRLLI